MGSSALPSRFRPFRIPRLLLRSQGFLFLRAANILLRTTGLQNFCALVQLIGLTGVRALLFAFARWRLVNSVSALIRHYFSSTYNPLRRNACLSRINWGTATNDSLTSEIK